MAAFEIVVNGDRRFTERNRAAIGPDFLRDRPHFTSADR
jgi:hypothetical protein